MSPQDPQRLDKELSALSDGRMSEEDRVRFMHRLAEDAEAREAYVAWIQREAMLEWEFGAVEAATPAALCEVLEKSAARRTRRLIGVGASVAAAACVLLAVAMFARTDPAAEPPVVAADAPDAVAVVTRTVDVSWRGPAVASDVALAAGRLALDEGLVQVEFYSGATVVLEGPAELELLSARHAIVHSGKIRAEVPPQAHGFTLTTSDMDVIDLGTEFALAVDPAGGTEIHVFDGEVKLAPHDQNAVTHLAAENAMRFTPERALHSIELDGDAFTDYLRLADLAAAKGQFAQRRWVEHARTIQEDPTALFYSTFEAPGGRSRTLANNAGASRAVPSGAIVGASWTIGRWPGKYALEFKRPSDRVRILIPGKFESLTLAAWIRVDGFDRRWNSLMLTDRWEHGDPHWQISEEGEIILGVSHREGLTNYFSPPVLSRADLGRWTHLTTVYDADAGEVTHYLDGEPVHNEAMERSPTLQIDAAEIGNWYTAPRAEGDDLRNFNGRMDEFAIWSRALTADEVQQMHQAGRPQ